MCVCVFFVAVAFFDYVPVVRHPPCGIQFPRAEFGFVCSTAIFVDLPASRCWIHQKDSSGWDGRRSGGALGALWGPGCTVPVHFQSSFNRIAIKFSNQFQCNFRAVSEQFRSNSRAVSEQFQSSFRAVSIELPSNIQIVAVQFQSRFSAVLEQF